MKLQGHPHLTQRHPENRTGTRSAVGYFKYCARGNFAAVGTLARATDRQLKLAHAAHRRGLPGAGRVQRALIRAYGYEWTRGDEFWGDDPSTTPF